MPHQRSPILRNPGEGEQLQVVTDRVRVLADSAGTGGACAVFEVISEPAGGPPLHRHTHDDECFFIVEGNVKFSVNGRETTLPAGGFTFVPRGTVHTFCNVGPGRSRMIVICTPGGLEGPFRECHALTAAGKATPEAIEAAFGKFDLAFVGPPLKP